MKTEVSIQANKQQGFTLIELIVVIVILGILAATAVPKFLDVQKDARISAITGVSGAIASAADLAHAAQLVAGTTSNTSVVLGGQTITMANGYPDAGINGILYAANITDNAGVSTQWSVSGGNTVRLLTDTGNTTCQVLYTLALAAGNGPVTKSTTTGCI